MSDTNKSLSVVLHKILTMDIVANTCVLRYSEWLSIITENMSSTCWEKILFLGMKKIFTISAF